MSFTVAVGWGLYVAYVLVCVGLLVYGANCYYLALARRRRPDPPVVPRPLRNHPRVTVQLPIFNEKYVVERLVRAVAQFEWPRDRLQIQILDDSDDDTRETAEQVARDWRARGFDVVRIHRARRTDYKAGALREGLESATGEFVAIFDADFIPPPDFLKRTIPYFGGERIACVQARWAHVNPDYSWFTRAQAIGIDGHFAIEQQARSAKGFFMNFNGTAGVWRRKAIVDGGNWTGDTLAEDLDLSYRVQERGWRILFLPDVAVPAEIPAQVQSLKRQQGRWARGSIQCARKHLPRVLRDSRVPVGKRLQAGLHLTHYAVHPLILLLVVLLIPLMLTTQVHWLFTGAFMGATFGPYTMYAYSQRLFHPGHWLRNLKIIVLLTFLGIGISASNTGAVLSGLFRNGGDFKRTPKFHVEQQDDTWKEKVYALSFDWTILGEAALMLVSLAGVAVAVQTGHFFVIPWLVLFAVSYTFIFVLSIRHLPDPKPYETPSPRRA